MAPPIQNVGFLQRQVVSIDFFLRVPSWPVRQDK